MTKPWEETWSYKLDAEDRAQIHVSVDGDWELVAEHGWQRSAVAVPVVEARFQLASAAPEMARVLMHLEWCNDDVSGPYCESCNAVRYNDWRELSMSDAEMWEHIRRVPGDNDHRADCKLDAAIRKAGVR